MVPPVLERFLRYVGYDTQSDESSTTFPSTEKQLVLLRDLAAELRALGLSDAAIDEHGYVMATVPATSRKPGVPTIGFIAHVDTSPEMSGANVKPIVHRHYDGRDLALPDDPSAVLRLAQLPELATALGHDIVTASGTTLLGGDDKAGVAAIVTAAADLMAHPEIPHGPVRIAFTPDEEVGRGTLHFDVGRFNARCAYTVDGGGRGEIETESFAADAMMVTFHGCNTHPGYGKGRLINAIKVAAAFIEALPSDALSPETTDGRLGYVHPYVLDASVDRTSVKLLVRDFDAARLREHEETVERLARDAVGRYPGSRVAIAITESYRNMKEILDLHPDVAAYAREAIGRAGLEVRDTLIRGGTDGSRLSFMGLPTPNLFAGEHTFHSRLEWVSVQEMEMAARVIVELCRVWEEKSR
jgi:tripeptide aminopeptidase